MIILTGCAGFVGSHVLDVLNANGHNEILAIDEIGESGKWENIAHADFSGLTDICRYTASDMEMFKKQLDSSAGSVKCVIALHGRADTMDTDYPRHWNAHIGHTGMWWDYCTRHQIPFIYASSAAVYGTGDCFSDSHDDILKYRPTNAYGFSKYLFDRWAIRRKHTPPCWYGLRFFNVYGSREWHKAGQNSQTGYMQGMASVVYKWTMDALNGLPIQMFASDDPNIRDGKQARDFVQVNDVANVVYQIAFPNGEPAESGLYNVGTGKAKTFSDIAEAIGKVCNLTGGAEYTEMPDTLRGRFQNFTQADIGKLRKAVNIRFSGVRSGIAKMIEGFTERDNLYRNGGKTDAVCSG